jgi:hypothetical protein
MECQRWLHARRIRIPFVADDANAPVLNARSEKQERI